MIFNQFEFLFLFLPVVVAGFIAMRGLRHEWLIAASCLFYGLSGYQHLLVLLFGTAWVWIVSRRERFAGNGRLLTLAIVPPLFFLFYYKYMGFVFGIFGGGAAGTTDFELFSNISLPAGISFFTFHLLAFAIDRYNGKIQPHPPFKDFLLFMSFFPHLVAGPILRYADVSAAIRNLPRFRIDGNVLAPAFGHIAAGLAAKILLADTLAKYIAQVTAEVGEVGFAGGMLVLGGYSFRIYFDFYGYSLVAIGLGLLFGFSFPKNFADPYKAPGIREFWRRWHMTLSFWIRDYLYLPLGGNARYVRNILIVFAACGLWHGAGWGFIVWGIAHGVLVVLQHRFDASWRRVPRLLRIVITFTAVSLLWTLFLFDLETAATFFRAMLGNGLRPEQVSAEAWAFLALAAIACFAFSFEKIAANEKGSGWLVRNVVAGSLLALALIFLDRSDTFIYFRF